MAPSARFVELRTAATGVLRAWQGIEADLEPFEALHVRLLTVPASAG